MTDNPILVMGMSHSEILRLVGLHYRQAIPRGARLTRLNTGTATYDIYLARDKSPLIAPYHSRSPYLGRVSSSRLYLSGDAKTLSDHLKIEGWI